MGLGRSEIEMSTNLGCRLGYLEGPAENIYPSAAECHEFAPSKTSIGEHVDHGRVL